MKWIGLTGGIATGKSAAAKLIQGLGFPVIDADEIARLVVQPGQEGLQKIVHHFGNSVLQTDQSLNRRLLGEIVFNSVEKRLLLESILHPLIQVEVAKLKQKYELENEKICFYDIPLLFEKGLAAQFFCTVLIWCDPETQKRRLQARNQLTEKQAVDRIKLQKRLSEKLPLANFCIDNSTTLQSLELQIGKLVKKLSH